MRSVFSVFIGAVLFVRLIRILYYAKLLADILSVRLESLSWAGTKAALTGATGKTRDYTPGLIRALRQGQTLLRLGGSSLVSSRGGAHAFLLVARPLIWGGCESLTCWALAPPWISGL